MKQEAPPGASHQHQNVQKAPWIPPPASIMKINVDAVISKNSSKASASAVARDSSSMFVGTSVVVTA